MKRFLVFAAALLLSTVAAFAQDGKSIYKKYSDQSEVSAVYISPAMFRLIGKVPDMKLEGKDVNLTPLVRSLSGMYIIDSENAAITDDLKRDVERLIASGDYELLMEAKDSGETIRMYTVGDDTVVNSFVMFALSGKETTFICFDGKINRNDLENLISSAM